jgi:hypothetical protein
MSETRRQLREHPGNFVTVPRAAEIAGVSVRTIGPSSDPELRRAD